MVLSYPHKGNAVPDSLPHPDDIEFVAGDYVHLRGEDSVDAAETRRIMVCFRDLMILKAEADYRWFQNKHPDEKTPIFISEYLYEHTNSYLPKRMQLTDAELLFRAMKGWKEFGTPSAKNRITPPIKPLLAQLGIHV